MVDSLSKLEQVYSKWESRNPWGAGSRTPQTNFNKYQSSMEQGKDAWKKRFGNNLGPPPNRRLRHNRSGRSSHNSIPVVTLGASNLCQFKVFPSTMPATGRIRPFMGRCCTCMPSSRNGFYEDKLKDYGVYNMLHIEGTDRDLISRNFKTLAMALRLKMEHKYPDISLAVLTSPRLIDAIQKTVQDEIGEGNLANTKLVSKKQKELKQRAKHRLKLMKSAMSKKLLRLTFWFLNHALSWFLDSVLLHKGQLAMIKKATKREVPVIYLPTHRSHLDYILVPFCLCSIQLQSLNITLLYHIPPSTREVPVIYLPTHRSHLDYILVPFCLCSIQLQSLNITLLYHIPPSTREVPVIYLPTHRSHLDYILVPFCLCSIQLQSLNITLLYHIPPSTREVPVIYLPTHRSHLDYILVTFCLCSIQLRGPHVAAGDNLRLPVFGSLLRGLGGFFIRRKLDRDGKKDLVYRAMLHCYMEEILRAGEHLEFFIEGGRTRSGKAIYPKGGLLSVIVDAYNEGIMEDALLVPVSIAYDKLLDGNFNREQMGEAKIGETFLGTLRAMWRVLNCNYGNVRLDFAQPFSLKEYLQVSQGYHQHTNHLHSIHSSGSNSPVSDVADTAGPNSSQPNLSNSPVSDVVDTAGPNNSSQPNLRLKRRGSTHSLYGTDIVVEDMRTTIQELAEHVVFNQVVTQSVMSSHVLAFLLLVKHREGASKAAIISSFDWLKAEISHRKRDLGFTGNTRDVVDHACLMLGDVVKVQNKSSQEISNDNEEVSITPCISLPSVFEMNYYSNIVNSVFAMESIMANAMYYLIDPEQWVNQGFENTILLSREAIIRQSHQLCNMFKYEFLLKAPCQQYETVICDHLDEFITSEILTVEEDQYSYADGSERKWSSSLAKSLSCMDDDSDEDEVVHDTNYILNQDSEISLEKFWFLKSVVAPLVECYYITSCNLVRLQTCDWVETEFVNTVHSCLKDRAKTGMAEYNESASLDTLKNALRSFEQQNVIDNYQSPTGEKMVGLNKKYRTEDILNEFIVQLEKYRS